MSVADNSFDTEFVEFCAANGIQADRWHAPRRLTPFPIIYGVRSALHSPHERWFGWYAARVAVRGVMLATNHLVAAARLLDDQLFGPSAACSYTAAYHALHSFLALKGRVLCDPIQWVAPSSQAEPAAVAAILTKDNKWRFEVRARSHRTKWLEVRDALAPGEVPASFEYLFAQLFSHRRRKGTTVLETIRDPAGTRAVIGDHWEVLLIEIANIRHQALYSSFGEDPYVVEALWNGDTVSGARIDRQARALFNFAGLLMHDCTSQLVEIAREVQIPKALHNWFSLVVQIPWFDQPRVEELPFERIAAHVAEIRAWIDPDTKSEAAGA